MNQRLAYIVASLAAVTLSACAQQEGDVCQRYGTAGQSDCAATLECCGEARTCAGIRQRGICVPDGTCPETTPLVCDGDDAGPSDAGEDAGAGDAGAGDAGAGDAGAGDAGAGDAGAGDAGAGDAGAGDAGAGDAGAGDAGDAGAGALADGGAAPDAG